MDWLGTLVDLGYKKSVHDLSLILWQISKGGVHFGDKATKLFALMIVLEGEKMFRYVGLEVIKKEGKKVFSN